MKANCIKVVQPTFPGYESSWGRSLGKYRRTYEIGKPTFPEQGTLLFCYAIHEDILNNISESPGHVFYAYADGLIEAKRNSLFSFAPIDYEIPFFWQMERLDEFSEKVYFAKHWRFASSITLLESIF